MHVRKGFLFKRFSWPCPVIHLVFHKKQDVGGYCVSFSIIKIITKMCRTDGISLARPTLFLILLLQGHQHAIVLVSVAIVLGVNLLHQLGTGLSGWRGGWKGVHTWGVIRTDRSQSLTHSIDTTVGDLAIFESKRTCWRRYAERYWCVFKNFTEPNCLTKVHFSPREQEGYDDITTTPWLRQRAWNNILS